VVKDLLAHDGLVCVFDRDEERGNSLEKDNVGRLLYQQADVRSEMEVHSGITKALETWSEKKIGGLVHCAGVGAADKLLRSRPLVHADEPAALKPSNPLSISTSSVHLDCGASTQFSTLR